MPKHYSGEASGEFWTRVAAIKDERLRGVVYLAACALQDVEGRMAQILAEAEGDNERERSEEGEAKP